MADRKDQIVGLVLRRDVFAGLAADKDDARLATLGRPTHTIPASITACAKCCSGAGQDYHPNPIVRRNVLHGFAQLADGQIVYCVPALGRLIVSHAMCAEASFSSNRWLKLGMTSSGTSWWTGMEQWDYSIGVTGTEG